MIVTLNYMITQETVKIPLNLASFAYEQFNGSEPINLGIFIEMGARLLESGTQAYSTETPERKVVIDGFVSRPPRSSLHVSMREEQLTVLYTAREMAKPEFPKIDINGIAALALMELQIFESRRSEDVVEEVVPVRDSLSILFRQNNLPQIIKI
jgi:hypothetical protein